MVSRSASKLVVDHGPAVVHLRDADPVLAKLIDIVGPCRMEIERERDTFTSLSRAIVYQQLTGKAAATIYGRVCMAATGRATGVLSAAGINALDDAALRGAGLSRSKLLALRDLAARCEAGEVPSLARLQKLDDEQIVELLTRVRGIGRWTVEMLLMFRLGRPDILPVGDYGVRKGFARVFRKRELPTPAQLAKRGARWAPHRSVASWYLWRATELPPDISLR
jgi:3-methyladenine DNA glycosylase/8-oxoguanine DNA glycosylase